MSQLRSSVYLARSLWFHLFFISIISAASADVLQDRVSLTVMTEQDDRAVYGAKFQKLFPTPFCVKKITFNADILLQQDEFFYLIDMKPGDIISHEQLTLALYYLTKKQKFESITVRVEDDDGIRLHFDFVSFWTFKKLKFKGIFVGKEFYRQHYIMEYGQRFEMKKHTDSVEKIVELFKRDGYFDARIDTAFVYDENTKSVLVNLYLHKGMRFSVGSVQVVLDGALVDKAEKDALHESIELFFVRPLLKNWYNRNFINAQTIMLKDFLCKEEFLHTEIDLEELLHYKTRRVDLTFTLALQYRKKFYFLGNQFYDKDQLLELMLAFGKSISLLPISILSEEIVKAYYDKGFWSVRVEAQERDGDYYFTIEEGMRARIAQIELHNLSHFNTKQLIKRFFSTVLAAKYFDLSLLDRAINKALTYFLTSGFWHSSLLYKKFEQLPHSKNAYKLVLTFDEGVQSFLKTVKISGFEELELKGPFKQYYQQKESVPFNPAILDEQRQWLQQHFQSCGYYQPKIKPILDQQEGEICVTWSIDLGVSSATFGKTVILGAQRFPFKYIQRELDYAIGDPWHSNALRHSISRLQKLEIFESVHLFPDKDVDQKNERIMLLKLQHDDPFELKTRLGLGIQHVTKSLTTGGLTYRVGGSFIWKNPINKGDQFRFDADCTRSIRLVNCQYRIPWIFNLPINAMVQGYTNRYEYPGFIGSQKNLYTVVQQGFLANFTSVFSFVDAALSTGFEVIDTFIDDSDENRAFAQEVAQAINFKPELLDKSIPFFLFQPTCILFYLDNTINPTRGSFTVLSVKGMFPMAKLAPSNFFIRILAEQSFFIPFMALIFAIRLRVGHIFHPKFSTIIPIERFYLGGANSIRSYETDQCPPLGVVYDNDQTLYVPQGGRSLANLNLEMQFPLYRKFGGVVFTDIGALSSNRLADIKAQDCLSGIGFGLRYYSAIGPLRFDFAWRGNKHDGVGRPYAWFVSLGNAFI